MRNPTHYIASKLIKNHDRINDPDVRSKYGVLEGWVSIIGNTILFLIKLIIGIQIHSTALIADAAHTLADSASSVIVIIGFVMMKKPSDKDPTPHSSTMETKPFVPRHPGAGADASPPDDKDD